MKKYWRSIEEIESGPVLNELEKAEKDHKDDVMSIFEGLPFKATASRRDFLKLISYSVASAALLAACRKPVQHAVPFLNQPTDIIPGVAQHYASTFFDGSEYCPVVAKVRDGRPIKLEGNQLYPFTKGGTSARVQASILSLYDNSRIKKPAKNKAITWNEADKEIIATLNELKKTNKEVVILASTIFSPSSLKAIQIFKDSFPNANVVYYDVPSASGMVDAYKEVTHKVGIPYPLFDKADVVVSFGCDFLGTWVLPTEFCMAYVAKRKLNDGQNKMSRHIQYEGYLSLTGSNADEHIHMKPSEELAIVANLYNMIASKNGVQRVNAPEINGFKLEEIAEELLRAKGKSIVISGSNDSNVQKIVIAINHLLDNYGKTFDIEKHILLRQGSDVDMFSLVDRMKAGNVGAIFFYNTNPCYNYFNAGEFTQALNKVDLKVSFSGFPNETTEKCDVVCPDNHFLESWNDFEPRPGIYSLAQPCINPVFDTRQMQESLLTWAGKPTKWHEFVKDFWQKEIFPKQNEFSDFDLFWIECLKNGILETTSSHNARISIASPDIAGIEVKKPGAEIELHMEVPIAITSDFHSNNPWLQELPDPITRVTWENYAKVSPLVAEELGLLTGSVINVSGKFDIPVVIQPGQTYKVISIALNYGRKNAGKVANEVGLNLYPFVTRDGENLKYYQDNIGISKVGKSVQLAQTQTHHTLEGRDIVRETTLDKYIAGARNELNQSPDLKKTLYPDRKFGSFHWGMSVDLNSCIGCGACVIACQAENNIAVVGKEQVIKRRAMHWIRIDRYYAGPPESPSVLFQPMTCQHCDNAPCENVCPVAATTHNDEGLNQMTYNRCVGTRYCINNCPYKVRRFNWLKFVDNPKFDYNQASELGKLVLNPDVVVRERGVVEKCTFCVQRIQEKKLKAKLENRELKDGEVVTACSQACPAGAIVFGDLNDKHSNVFKLYNNDRNYFVLEELHTLPKIGYLTKVRNKEV